jgi:hypothetical protein
MPVRTALQWVHGPATSECQLLSGARPIMRDHPKVARELECAAPEKVFPNILRKAPEIEKAKHEVYALVIL